MLNNLKNLKLRLSRNDHVSEEDVRQALNNDIKDYLLEKYNFNILFRNEVATSVHTYIDSRYENFVIEYKAPDVNLCDENRKQLKDYLEDLGTYAWGILTNAKQLEIYVYSSEENDFVLNEKLSGEINEEQFRYICEIISNKEKLVITDLNINGYLGVDSNKEIIKKIFELAMNSTNERTKLFYDEWQKLFNLSEAHDNLDTEKQAQVIKFYQELFDVEIDNIEKQYKALFSIQTYYSIVLKLMLHKIILDKTSSHQSKPTFLKIFFKEIENNQFYRNHNILNLIDGDFFSWYLNEFSEEDFNYFYDKIAIVTTIDTKGENLLFIKLYENIFPFWVRHAMGEYYTPLYLAGDVVENTLKIAKTNGNIKLLDPTCGSGIFLIYALNRGIKNVYGIDINPLAVLTSKINYLLNNFNLDSPVEIPIYLGDSTYFPSLETYNGISCFTYELTTSIHDCQSIKFVFAEDIVNELKFFEILDEIEVQIQNKNFSMAINVIKSYPNFHYSELSIKYDELINTLIDLEKRNLNSIWLKIIGNYLKTGSLRNMDCITGNPPWVRWSNLPDTYKLLIKNNCRIDGIFSNDTNSGGVDLNIAALIAFITVRERLNNNGCLGFIMPDSLLFNKSFEGFRNFKFSDGRQYYLNKVVRWNNPNERPFDPVSLDFGEYFFSYKKPSEIEVFDRKDDENKIAFRNPDSFNNHYSILTKLEFNEVLSVLGHNDLVFRSGISLVKGGYYQLEFKQKISNKISEFYHYEKVGGSLKKSNDAIKLETDIVYPFIKTPDINDSEITSSKYFCIFPYSHGSKEPMSLNVIRTQYPLFYQYFMRPEIQSAINSASSYNSRIQNNTFDVGIFRVGEYTWSDYFLATRDNTKSMFAKVGMLMTPWGEKKQPLFDGHINYVSRDSNDNPLTKDTIDNIFNAFIKKGVKIYIKCSSDARSISGRLYNDIKID